MGTALCISIRILVFKCGLANERQIKLFAGEPHLQLSCSLSGGISFFSPLWSHRHEQDHETVGETDRKESCGKEGDECNEPDEEC